MPLDKTAPLLLVEDEEDDVLILRQAFQKTQADFPIEIARNGEFAMQYLTGAGAYSDRSRYPLPFLILLDLKMPGWDGFDFLQWLQRQETLREIPVVVLTSSGLDDDVRRAFSLGAKSYLIKPSDFADLQDLTRLLKQYWPLFGKLKVEQHSQA